MIGNIRASSTTIDVDSLNRVGYSCLGDMRLWVATRKQWRMLCAHVRDQIQSAIRNASCIHNFPSHFLHLFDCISAPFPRPTCSIISHLFKTRKPCRSMQNHPSTTYPILSYPTLPSLQNKISNIQH